MFSWCIAIFIVTTNSVALKTLKALKPTFLNLLIGIDCSIGVCIAPTHLMLATDILPPGFCNLKSIIPFTLSMMNGLIPVGIVLYRVVHVCCATRVMTAPQRKDLECKILMNMLGFSILLTISALYHMNHSNDYIRCIGESKVGAGGYNLPFSHPHHLATIIAFVSRTVFVPVGYLLIFLFRVKNANEAPGLSENSRKKRRIRNAVNAKYNFYIWLSENSIFLMFVYRNPITIRIFLGISFGLSPILYLIGMEETRSELRSFAKLF